MVGRGSRDNRRNRQRPDAARVFVRSSARCSYGYDVRPREGRVSITFLASVSAFSIVLPLDPLFP